jgi:hypothetical protein
LIKHNNNKNTFYLLTYIMGERMFSKLVGIKVKNNDGDKSCWLVFLGDWQNNNHKALHKIAIKILVKCVYSIPFLLLMTLEWMLGNSVSRKKKIFSNLNDLHFVKKKIEKFEWNFFYCFVWIFLFFYIFICISVVDFFYIFIMSTYIKLLIKMINIFIFMILFFFFLFYLTLLEIKMPNVVELFR